MALLSTVAEKFARRLERMPPEAPKGTIATVKLLAEIIRFGYSETLGTWGLFDLPRAILRDLKDKDKETIASECDKRSDCVRLNAPELLEKLYELQDLLRMTILFSKKRFGGFLLAAGFDKADVLYRRRTARILKPAFTVILNRKSKCLFVFVRGTRSIKDTLTDVIGAAVQFKLKTKNVSGHAHRGMLSAARWIERKCISKLLEALRQYPDFKVKIVGHSLGGGTAALLTYKLREIQELSSCTCVTFGPAACMTLELAEFGKPFITSIINGSDIVPTLSASSVHDFISKGQIKNKKDILTAVGSRLQSFPKAIAERVVTRRNKFVMKHGQGTSTPSETSYESVSIEEQLVMESRPDDPDDDDKYNEGSDSDNSDNDGNELMNQVGKLNLEKQDNVPNIIHSTKKEADNDDEEDDEYNEEQLIMESMSDDDDVDDDDECNEGSDSDDSDELMNQVEKLKQEKQHNVLNIIHSKKKEAATSKNITDEKSVCSAPALVNSERHDLYPPGKIMHIVLANCSEKHNSNRKYPDEEVVYLYETPTQFYGKFRLRKGIILHHLTKSYWKKLGQLVNQLEKEHLQYG